MAEDAPVAQCSRYPLVVFSHGFGGCSVQSVFFAEALARAGYAVAAPDHQDSRCKVDRPLRGNLLQRPEVPFLRPGKWTDSTYRDRMEDIRQTIDEVTRDRRIGGRIDAAKIGAAGHSLGGYTVLGMTGGWSSWKDDRIKAALLMSPYVAPYLVAETMSSIHVPVMYQGGTRDNRVTPEIRKKAGAYDKSNAPKYYVEFEGARHLDWSNMTCGSRRFVPDCAAEAPQARLIVAYAVAFFNRYLKGESSPLLNRPNARVADYRYVD